MECKECGEEMVLERYKINFLWDNEICMREEFGCVHCNATAVKLTYYTKTREEVSY